MAAQFTEALAGGRLIHSDDPTLNRHVLAASARSGGEAWRFVEPRKTKRPIDGLIALCMALSVMSAEPEPSKEIKYTDQRGMGAEGAWVLDRWVTGERAERYRDLGPGEGSLSPTRGR